VAQLQAGLSKAISDADSDPNPYVRQNAARMIPVIQQSISRAQQQADTADARAYTEGRVTEARTYEDTHTEALRTADVKRATDQAEALITGGQFSDAQANVIRQTASAGSEALNAVRSTIMTKAFADHNSILTPEQVRAAGFPVGSVVSQNDTSGAIKLEYNPRPDETAALNARTQQFNAQSSRMAAEAARDKNASGQLNPDSIKMRAAQAESGDKSAFQSLGLGAIGASNRAAITNQMTQDYLGMGMTPAQAGARVAQINSQYVGQNAENRALGQRAGAATFANAEMPQAVTLAKEAYSQLPRGAFVPFNRMRRLYDNNTSSPEQAQAYIMDEDAITSYARALSPNGIPRKADIERGEKMLSGANSIEAHNATLDAMQLVVERRQAAGQALVTPAAPGVKPAPTHTTHIRPPSISADVWAHMTPAEQDLF